MRSPAPVSRRKISSARCGGVPVPEEPPFNGRERAAATRSAKLRIGEAAGTTATSGSEPSRQSGETSRAKS